MCERAWLIWELREWLRWWVEGRGIHIGRLAKVELAPQVLFYVSGGKRGSLKGVRLGSALKRKGLCLLFTQFFCLDFQESKSNISPKSPVLDTELGDLWVPLSWPGMIPHLAEPTRSPDSPAYIMVPDQRSRPHCMFGCLRPHRDLLGNRILGSLHLRAPISALSYSRRAGKSHQSLAMACVVPSPTTVLSLRTDIQVLLYFFIWAHS